MKLWSIDGNSQRLDGGAMFGNAPRAMWSTWIAPDAQNRIPLACRALLARPLNGRTVLFETGIGAFFEPKLRERYGVVEERHVLLDSLRAAGVEHTDIDIVVLSHLHFDHAGGLLTAWEEGVEPQLLFPNALYLVGGEQWRRATHPHVRDRASYIGALPPLLEASGRLRIVDGDRHESLGDSVRFHYSNGHTPGLMLAEIVGPQRAAREGGALDVDQTHAHGGVVFCSDLVPGTPWVNVPITMGYDRSAELLIDEKRAFLDDMLARNVHLFFTHDPGIAMAQLVQDARGKFGTAHALAQVQARGIG